MILHASEAANAFAILVHHGFDGEVRCDRDTYDIELGTPQRVGHYEVVAFCHAPEDVDTLREHLNVRGFVDGGVMVGPKR